MSHVQTKLERVTVNLIPAASNALREGTELTGHSKTDFINRAVQLYTYVQDIMSSGGTVMIREPGEDEPSKIMLL